MINRNREISKYAFLFVVVAAFISNILKLVARPTTGWDHDIYCKAAEAWNAGLDPFITENLGLKLSYTYPVLFLSLYQYVCGIRFVFIYIDALLLIAITWLLVRKLSSDWVIATPFMLLGYNSAYSNVESGNLGIIEAFLLVLGIVAAINHKKWCSLFLVPMSFLKVVPAVMVIPLWLSNIKWKDRFVQVFIFICGVGSLVFANYFLSPGLFFSFIKQATGGYSNQHSPISEMDSNASNPTVIIFLKNLSIMIYSQFWLPVFLIFIVGLGCLTYWVWKSTIRFEKEPLYKICWSYLLILLWIPRLKPYALILLCVVMVPILSKLPKRFSISILLLTIFHRVINGTKTNPWWELISNNTAIYTMIAVLILMTLRWREHRFSIASTAEAK
ncbi:glycosyltransferase 87 family protein [Bdellovibrio sp. KM01]|uniref:glycosyltransferase 87 family protein n=1 Tax=Bdellovibrio sp. KM01 TaxID=2748865 RepID=UPI0015E9C32E|nr:glycosyltransferase 87 family protein [Bdellovibrio sp. KM01]QLY27030.1 hypothetical protein HW988_08565 [Bdellovibrio sp. KM01]